MEILYGIIAAIGDALATTIEYVTGKAVSKEMKDILGWIGTVTGALLGPLAV